MPQLLTECAWNDMILCHLESPLEETPTGLREGCTGLFVNENCTVLWKDTYTCFLGVGLLCNRQKGCPVNKHMRI